jgi:hypothetical protein
MVQRGLPHLDQHILAGSDRLGDLGKAHRQGRGRIHHERTHLNNHSLSAHDHQQRHPAEYFLRSRAGQRLVGRAPLMGKTAAATTLAVS